MSSNKPNKTPADPRFAERTDAPHAPNDLPMDAGVESTLPKNPEKGPDAEPANPVRKPVTLFEGAMRAAEQARNTWRVTVPAGTTPEDLRSPMTWAHNARRLRAGDVLEILYQDWSRYVIALVREVTPRAGAAISIVSDTTLEQLRRSDEGGFEIGRAHV